MGGRLLHVLGFARPGLRFPIRRSRSNNVQTDSTLKVLRHGMRLCSAQISSCWSQMGSTHEVFVAVVVFSKWLSVVFLQVIFFCRGRPELLVCFLSLWRCTVIPESLVLLLDGVYSPKMKGANWLKFICHQGRSLVNNFSLCNNLYKSVVLSLIWLHSFVCQIHNKQMSQLVAYSGNICVWVVSWGLTVRATLSQHKRR